MCMASLLNHFYDVNVSSEYWSLCSCVLTDINYDQMYILGVYLLLRCVYSYSILFG